MKKYAPLFRDPPKLASGAPPTMDPTLLDTTFRMGTATKTPPGSHTHEVVITADQKKSLEAGHRVLVFTTQNEGHSHQVELMYDKGHHSFQISHCDGQTHCWDGHPRNLYLVS